MKLKQECPICSKPLELVSSFDLVEGDKKIKMNNYKCGHCFANEVIEKNITQLDFHAADGSGKAARAYQREGIQFIIESDFNCIIGDQMRLGKTPQALLALKNAFTERTPALIIVRATNLWQWVREYKTWTDVLPNGIWPIIGTKGFIPPGFSAYIISMDTFSRSGTCEACGHSLNAHNDKTFKCSGSTKGQKCRCSHAVDNHDSMADKLREFPFKLIIADEAHSFKNTDSNRAQALIQFLKEKNTVDATRELHFKCPMCSYQWDVEQQFKIINGEERAEIRRTEYCPKCSTAVGMAGSKNLTTRRECGVVLLTGTAIKNRADEYFVPLNLVAPTLFPSLDRFRRRWLMQDSKGQWSRVSPYLMESFKETIAPYVLRREKEDVYKDLPVLNRMFTVIEPEKDVLTQQYNKMLDKLDAKLAERANPSFWDFQEDLMQLRRICGLMKVPWTADYAETCLMDDNASRLVIGIHHYDVADILKFKLSHLGILKLDGKTSPEQKDWIMTHFQATPERILAMNMLAGGVGMDFPYVEKILILERQWSFADEQQFEFRFYNPDKDLLKSRGISENKITDVEYIIAKGTLDEFWYNMVEVKKNIQGQTIGTNWDIKTTPGMFRELLQDTLSHRL